MSGVEYIDVPFGAYLPDFGGAPNPEIPGYLTDAVGIRRVPHGYRGMPVFASLPGATAIGAGASVFGGRSFLNESGDNIFFVGDAAGTPKIYESTDYGVTWTDVTPATGYTAPWAADYFSFDADCIIVHSTKAPQKRSLAHASLGTAFIALGGSPPTAKCGARVRQHVVLGGLSTDSYAVQWSAIGNHEDWPTPGSTDALAKESGKQVMSRDWGPVNAIVGGDKIGVVFQTRALTRMTYQGGNTVYAFDTYNTSVGYGVGSYNSKIASDGERWYWYNENGFFVTDGYSVERLDDGAIEDAIFNRLLSHSNQAALSTLGMPAYDSHRHLIVYGGNAANPTLCYHIDTGTFSWLNDGNVVLPIEGVKASGTGATSGYSLFNVDLSSRKLEWLSGDGSALTMQTGFIEIDPGYEVQIEGAHLLGTAVPGSLTIACKGASTLANVDLSQAGFTSMTAQARGQKSKARTTAQYFAFRITGTGSEAQLLRGLRIYYSRGAPAQ